VVWPERFAARAGRSRSSAIGTTPVGAAAITGSHVIHAASTQLGERATAPPLQGSTVYTLRMAVQNKLKTIVFPAIGTRIAGFALQACAEIMLRESVRHLEGSTSLEEIYFVLFDARHCKCLKSR
jgi:O-acetyl-ADP-ribose deacetylase (regulator of RNase III)